MPKFATSWDDWTSDSSPRPQALGVDPNNVLVVIHHAYNQLVQDSIALFKPGGREVSANFAIGPTARGSETTYCVGTVPEDRRAWTTASWVDGYALTAEVSNLDLGAPYPVALSAKEWLAQIVAYANITYGMPIDDYHVTTHQEVFARGWDSYATACPGGDLQGSKPWIIERAKQIVVAYLSGSTWKDETVRIYESGKDSGQFAMAPVPGKGWVRFNADGIANARGVLAQAFGPIITQFPADFAAMEKLTNSIFAGTSAGGGAAVNLQPVLDAIAAGEAQDAKDLQALLTAISQVDENTLATFGLKRA